MGLDLDSCIDPQTGIADWANEIITRFNTYGEISPSGKGVKLFFRGEPEFIELFEKNSEGEPLDNGRLEYQLQLGFSA